jgi:hypothetical protein
LQPPPPAKSFARPQSPYALCENPLGEPAVVRLIVRELEHPPSTLPAVVHADKGGVQPEPATHAFPEHVCPDVQSLLVRHCTQLAPFRQCGVEPLQATHVGPQCALVLHGSHCDWLHHSPDGQSPLTLHSTHAPLTQPNGQGMFEGV